MGATLLPSKVFYRVFSSSSHALPVVRCLATDVDGADVRLRPCENGLKTLYSLSPLFGKLWNDDCGPLGPEYPHLVGQDKKSTFQIVSLVVLHDEPQLTFLSYFLQKMDLKRHSCNL
jgi:polynucleotide 5'-hydroxyl-kinase GRC3/NOL9